MPRIAIAGFLHETNCFVPDPTDYDNFDAGAERPPIVKGDLVLSDMPDTGSGTGGFLAEANEDNHEIAPLLWASAMPGGTVTAGTYERIVSDIIARLSAALPVDGVYLDLHGAMVSEAFPDGEGELLRRVRAVVGDVAPIVISLDYHANMTPEILAAADAILPYRTYPHVDQREAGARAAVALRQLLLSGRPDGRAQRHAPFLLPLNYQCTYVSPSKDIIAAGIELEAAEDVLSVAYLAGFPPSDLRECGPSVTVHALTQAAADAAADKLMARIIDLEAAFAEPLLEPDAAVAEAMSRAVTATKPVVIADTQDNPGCGGSGDTVGMLAALVRQKATGALFGMVADADAAAAAHAAGIGASLSIDLGGRTALDGVEPYSGIFKVVALTDGTFQANGPVSQGRRVNVGPSALLQIDDILVAVGSHRVQALDRAVFEHFDLKLSDMKIVVLKSTCHYRADIEPLADSLITALAPGGYIADPARHPYQKLREGVKYRPLGEVHTV